MTSGGRAVLAALALPAITACAGPPPAPVRLPPAATDALADPARQAILSTADAFAAPGRLAGRPAVAAAAIAQAEFLAVELATGQRWIAFAPRAAQGFVAARAEWREAAGIAPDAAPQPVIDALLAARAALFAGSRDAAAAALAPPAFPHGGEAVLARLGALPPLPLTARAAAEAQQELWRDQLQIETE